MIETLDHFLAFILGMLIGCAIVGLGVLMIKLVYWFIERS